MTEVKKKKKNRFLHLTDHEAAGDNITHLLKTGATTRSSSVETYQDFSKYIPKRWRGVKIQYDLWYDHDELDQKTKKVCMSSFLYTDMLNKCLYFRVPNERLNKELFEIILLNKHETINTAVIERIVTSLSDKYTLLNTSVSDHSARVVFLPGSNILESILDYNRVQKLVENEGAKIKPHPLTTKFHQFILKKKFGEAAIIDSNTSGFECLVNADVVFCCKNSEMGLTALLMNKSMCLVDNEKYKNYATYSTIYDTILRTTEYTAREALCKILSSDYSGIFHLEDPDAEQKMYNFLNTYNLLLKKP
jgi:hypothetical protein